MTVHCMNAGDEVFQTTQAKGYFYAFANEVADRFGNPHLPRNHCLTSSLYFRTMLVAIDSIDFA